VNVQKSPWEKFLSAWAFKRHMQEIAKQLTRVFYSVEETAQILGVCEKTVYRLLKRGLLKSSSALRTKLISADSIKVFSTLTVEGGGK
jgi:transposase-like protein